MGKFSDKPMIYNPGIIYQQQFRYNYISVGSNMEYNPFISGIWLRSDQNFTLESLIILAGYRISNFRIVYSYDMRLINFSKIL
ncbi:MAG: type IX secretion system membrane protein PorP/SprF [Bacteroidales bacterium]|nr:type IX secretion system membrane protein PorP/SprF [Bacteroidales bacterium]